jgi:hypothetical protein
MVSTSAGPSLTLKKQRVVAFSIVRNVESLCFKTLYPERKTTMLNPSSHKRLIELGKHIREASFAFSDALLKVDQNKQPIPDMKTAARGASIIASASEEVQQLLSKEGV